MLLQAPEAPGERLAARLFFLAPTNAVFGRSYVTLTATADYCTYT